MVAFLLSKTAGSGVITITSNDDSVSSTRAVTRRTMLADYWQFCFHFPYHIHSSVENPAPANCRFAVEPTWGFGKVKAGVERLQCSSCATLGRCLAAGSASLGFSLHHQLCRRPLHLTSATSPHFARTLRQRRLARTSCQERINNYGLSLPPPTLAYSISSQASSIYATRLATL